MAGISVFITNQGVLVADGATAAAALQQRFSSAIASGEATHIVINQANNGAPIVEGATSPRFSVAVGFRVRGLM
jgi:hypothetical protein